MSQMMDREKLEKLLGERMPNIHGKEVWIWGAGNTSALYQQGFSRLAGEGFEVSGYVDRDPSKIGGIHCGKPVISPEDLARKKGACVLVCSAQPSVVAEIRQFLGQFGGIEQGLLSEVILKMHGGEVLRVYDSLEDDLSKGIYAELASCFLDGHAPREGLCQPDQYFALEPFSIGDPNEVFVDCGAYIGDTLVAYLQKKGGCFKKIYCFEPDKANFAQLESQAESLSREWGFPRDAVSLVPYGVGEHAGSGMFERYADGTGSKFVTGMRSDSPTGMRGESPTGTRSKFPTGTRNGSPTGTGTQEGDCGIVSLDEYLTEPYSFLKADIEGFEYQMLQGAREGIRKYKPKLAICIYHNAVDFYSIPLLVKEILPEYHLAVRHHSEKMLETVLYAWV